MSESHKHECGDEGSISRVIRHMQDGDESEVSVLWDRFYTRLTFLVRKRLHHQLRTIADEEDVALDSLLELFRGLLEGKYPSLDNRESLWRLLVTVASRNVLDEVNREGRLKRGGGNVVHESAFSEPDAVTPTLFDKIPSTDDAPDVQVMITERCTDLLESLDDPELQAIALMKTAGSKNQEVADSLAIGLRTVERRLLEIRKLWSATEN